MRYQSIQVPGVSSEVIPFGLTMSRKRMAKNV